MNDKLEPIPAPRKRDGQERRRELCDAAIQVLAEHGSRGLTHQRVDQTAEVPDGTTSYYYRTRAALVRGVGNRVAEIDRANLRSLTDATTKSESPFGRLAQLVVMQSEGQGLYLNRARLELSLAASRDPALAEIFADFASQVIAMSHDAIAAVYPGTADLALHDAQIEAITTFIAGAFTRFAFGDRTLAEVDRVERLLHGAAAAVIDPLSQPAAP